MQSGADYRHKLRGGKFLSETSGKLWWEKLVRTSGQQFGVRRPMPWNRQVYQNQVFLRLDCGPAFKVGTSKRMLTALRFSTLAIL